MLTKTYHPQFAENQDYWIKADDVFNNRIKALKTQYLPIVDMMPAHVNNPELTAFINKKYNEQIWPMAVFYNFVNPTVDAVSGAIMRKPPTYRFTKEDTPSDMDYLNDNADGKGNGLNQLSRKMCSTVELKGRCGLLTDVPRLTNVWDLKTGKVAPRLAFYSANQIIDWETDYRDGVEVLTFVSLYERRSSRNIVPGVGTTSGTVNDYVERIVNFYLDEEDNVVYHIREDNEQEVIDYQMKDGSPASSIPFYFCGALTNDADVDPAPAHTLVELNLLHYRMMSRDMQARFDLGQLQWHVDLGSPDVSQGDPVEMMKKLNPNGFIAGSAIPAITAYGGTVEILQANEANLLSKTPIEIEDKAVKVGAQLFQDSGSNETATAANIRASSSTASMSSIAANVGDCIYNALVDLAGYIKFDSKDIEFSLNMDFFAVKLSPQDKIAYMQLVQQGILPQSAMYQILRKNGDLSEDVTYQNYIDDLEDTVGMGGQPSVTGE